MRRQPTRRFRTRRHTFLALVAGALMVLGAQAPSWASEAATTVAAESGRAPSAMGEAASGRKAAPSMDDAYASREASSKPLEKFKGGDIVVIGSSGLVLILVIILIIVIL